MEYKLEIGEKQFLINLENLAEQANGSAFVRLGDTLVLATVTMSSKDLEGLDFFPLTVEFEEKYYAAGKILGSRFLRREGRPSDEAILTARLIDRAIRPLFPKNLKREVQVIVSCYSFDEKNDPDVPGLLATSLALMLSDIPWKGPAAPIRVTKNDGKFLVNPGYQEREVADFDLVLSGVKREGVLVNMIEAQAKETKEEEILKAIEFSKEYLKKIIDFQEEITKIHGKEKIQLKEQVLEPEIEKEIKKKFGRSLEETLMQKPAIENKKGLESLKEEIFNFVKEKFGEEKVEWTKSFILEELRRILHRNILEKEKRPDGRNLDEIRPIQMDIGILPRAHGSALFVRGKTKALSTVTLGSPSDQRLIEGMEVRGKKRFMHHYNFPPFCSGEVKPIKGPGRREIGHGMLAEKALLPVIPNFEDFPYTIRVVTEILSSNGSTSMASVSSSSLALMDAGVPIKKPVAGIAIGLISDKRNYKILCDIQGPEDHFGDMDFKVAGTDQGICAIQMDVKIEGLTEKMIEEALFLAKKAREKILEKMKKIIAKPRTSLSPFAPKILRVKINPEKIGEVIGPGGRVINEIIEKCEVSIDIEEDGNIFVTSSSFEAAKKAVDWIKNITRDIKIGEIFKGKVKRILNFGAIVEILPGKEGLVHISELAPFRVKKVSDIVKVGDIIPVKVIGLDETGKIFLSLKQAKKKG
jgi:polyribonucleotide nucleotidyltransferase